MPQAGHQQLTAAEIVGATGAVLVAGDPDRAIRGVSIDSRTITAGELFIAIRGERFDGHAFVDAAVDRGAAGAMVSTEHAVRAGALPVFLVPDTTRALQDLARYVRRRSNARVVAITGSAGKTTTKEVAAEFLATKYRVFRNTGNLNNHIGLPLSLLGMADDAEIAVVELGMNHPGEIATLVGVAEPEIRVWTNVGDAHLGFFASSDAIADAKAEILLGAGRDSVLVANADDERVMARASRFAGRTVTFGLRSGQVRASAIEERGVDGVRARLHTPSGDAELVTPLVGLGNLANILAATAVALEVGVPLDAIAARAPGLAPAPHRGAVLRLPGGVTVLDDSYNSSPSALRHALEAVARTSACARRGAVLGEMLELGDHAIGLHEASGRAAAGAGLAWLVTVGGAPARALADAAREAGLPSNAVTHVATKDEAADLAARLVRAGDLVLVKGSRGIGLERVVARLEAEHA
jgi:UDP-N-acetylmuramoyl-tripeptide--D-alanyl-D-alanine ligase